MLAINFFFKLRILLKYTSSYKWKIQFKKKKSWWSSKLPIWNVQTFHCKSKGDIGVSNIVLRLFRIRNDLSHRVHCCIGILNEVRQAVRQIVLLEYGIVIFLSSICYLLKTALCWSRLSINLNACYNSDFLWNWGTPCTSHVTFYNFREIEQTKCCNGFHVVVFFFKLRIFRVVDPKWKCNNIILMVFKIASLKCSNLPRARLGW